MTGWTEEDLGRVGEARELQLASFRRGGTLRPYVTMWVVWADDELYVRSAYGPNNPWFLRAKASGGEGRGRGEIEEPGSDSISPRTQLASTRRMIRGQKGMCSV